MLSPDECIDLPTSGLRKVKRFFDLNKLNGQMSSQSDSDQSSLSSGFDVFRNQGDVRKNGKLSSSEDLQSFEVSETQSQQKNHSKVAKAYEIYTILEAITASKESEKSGH